MSADKDIRAAVRTAVLTLVTAGVTGGEFERYRQALVGARCAVTELLTEQCAHCRPAPPVDVFDEPSPYGPWMQARWWGQCEGCGERYDAGDKIRADGCGWLAECCGSP
jgi:hypothetical protein